VKNMPNDSQEQARNVYKKFDDRWCGFEKHNPVSRIVFYAMDRQVLKVLLTISRGSILDIGCGIGRSLTKFRRLGFSVVGIDNSPSSIEACSKKGLKPGKDVFKMDASAIGFRDSSFDVVFSEGLLEHFENYDPFVREMVRVSGKYILLIQPNYHSLAGKTINLATRIIKKENPKEIPYRMEDYVESFKKYGCELVLQRSAFFDAFRVFLFKN